MDRSEGLVTLSVHYRICLSSLSYIEGDLKERRAGLAGSQVFDYIKGLCDMAAADGKRCVISNHVEAMALLERIGNG